MGGRQGLAPSVTLEDGTRITAQRGYCLARVVAGAAPFTFVNTHLAVASSLFRAAQASVLLERLAAVEEPVVLVGDTNTGPHTPDRIYDTLTDEFSDAHAAAVGDRARPAVRPHRCATTGPGSAGESTSCSPAGLSSPFPRIASATNRMTV